MRCMRLVIGSNSCGRWIVSSSHHLSTILSTFGVCWIVSGSAVPRSMGSLGVVYLLGLNGSNQSWYVGWCGCTLG